MTTCSRLHPLLIALTLMFTLPLTGCGDKSPESRIEDAKQAIQKSDYKAAVIELKSALQDAPSNAEARMLLGQTFQAVGQWDNSEKELRKAKELGIPAEKILPLLAKTLLKMGKFKETTELVIPTATLTPLSQASIHAEKANAFMGLKNFAAAAEAISEGDRVLVLAGGNAFSNDLQLAKARLLFLQNKPDQVLPLLDAILQRDAKFVDALYVKAQYLVFKRNVPEALKVYEQIAAAKPDEIQAHLTIADFKLQEKDLVAAEKALQAAEKINNQYPLAKFTRAKLFLAKGDLKGANEALQQVLRVAPDHLPSLMLDATVNYGLGNHEQSLKSANKVLARVPGNFNAIKLVAANELRSGNTKAVLNTLPPLLQANPEDIQLLSMLGEANLQTKQYDKAMAYLDRAAALQPKNVTIKQSQARGYLALGQADHAAMELEQATSLSEKVGQADLALVMLHLNSKNFDKAQAAIASLDKKQPNNPVTSNLSGMAYLGKGDRIAARKAFERSLTLQPDFFPAAANLARLDLADKKPDAARQRFESILKKDANNIQAMMALAELAAANKQEQDAVQWLERAAKADPKSLPPRTALVNHYMAKKNFQKATLLAREAVSAEPENMDALSLLGSAQNAAGDRDSALSTFTRVAEKMPTSAEALYRLGSAQILSKRVNEGRASLEKALTLKSSHAGALNGLLLLDAKDQKFDRAMQRVRTFQAQNPSSPVGFVREAEVLIAQKQYAQAAKAYEQGFDRSNDLAVFAKMQTVLVGTGQQKLANQKLEALLSRYPKDLRVQSYAANYYLELGRNAESLHLHEALQRVQPNNPTILNNLALLYQRQKDRRALATAEQAYKLAPTNPGIMDTLGWIVLEQGQTARAVDLLQQASAKAPKSPTLRYHLAAAHAKAGKRAEAKRELGVLLKSGGKFPELEEARKLAASL